MPVDALEAAYRSGQDYFSPENSLLDQPELYRDSFRSWKPSGDLPVESPLEMPEQDFAACDVRARVAQPRGIMVRRAILVGGAGVLALAAARALSHYLAQDGFDLFDGLLLVPFFALFAWIAFSFLGALAGFLVLTFGGAIDLATPQAGRAPRGRTAVLAPIYNEDVSAIFGRLERMTRSVAEAGGGRQFDFFVLSDSRLENHAAEHAAYRALRAHSRVPVYYRRRPLNHARKPGNIADWVRRFGGAYDYMLVLDADSLMSGEAMIRLAATLDERPEVGLVQTVPAVTGAVSPFARWQQFASRFYGPVSAAGLIWWSGAEATFWGHNAILRVRAFAESCGLPKLSGREPFGGHIMSHDMVEAALLRRRGWATHMIAMEHGSYEEFPPTVVDHAIRDRRWCQGNLQHLRLLGAARFHWVHRLHLLMGASSYLTAPLWLMLMAAGVAERLKAPFIPTQTPPAWLLALTAGLLFGGKLLPMVWAALSPRRRRRFGGWRGLVASIAVDLPLSVLMAPMMMMNQVVAIADILRGRPSGWPPQRRQSDGIAFIDAVGHYRAHLAVGVALALVGLVDAAAAVWRLPVTVGLIAAPMLATLTSSRDLGERLARLGIFRTPESVQPTANLRERWVLSESSARRQVAG
ncbi:glucans biosynthesis glucosyltransferase MdoH [Caulobacter sp. KR2-114]|uniref:glucans biosynthesis glucosyltransferase MdoH n=1 Tax=Caulobacter sp. KR2-114 TaxID=3400912 RepID=UPI003BFE26BF